MNPRTAHVHIAEHFLRFRGITDERRVANILSGFDFSRPVYEQIVEPGDRIFQFVRLPRAGQPFMETKNWFCLSGATMDGLAIFGGLSGRVLKEFTVARPIIALEGTAAALARDWGWDGGGRGGATQMFVADQDLLALAAPGS